MPITIDDIAARRETVKANADRAQADLRAAQEELAALAVIERNIRAETEPAPSLTLPGVESDETAKPTIPFAQAVRDAVLSLRGIQFTVRDVEDVLHRTSVPLPLKNARTRITLILLEMVSKRLIVRTHAGTGNAPHRYRLPIVEKSEGTSAVVRGIPSNINLPH